MITNAAGNETPEHMAPAEVEVEVHLVASGNRLKMANDEDALADGAGGGDLPVDLQHTVISLSGHAYRGLS